jgi:hypothetical protein
MLISLPLWHFINQYGACIVKRSIEGIHVKALFNLSEEDNKKKTLNSYRPLGIRK